MKKIFVLIFAAVIVVFPFKIFSQDDTEMGIVKCSLGIEVLKDSVRFTIIAVNETDTRAVLQFPSSQQYDFIVKSQGGELVWQWSRGKMFAQMLTAVSMDPGEKKEFTEEYNFLPGKYTATGVLTTSPEKIFTESKEFIVKGSKVLGKLPPIKGKITKIGNKLYFLGKDGTAYLVEDPSQGLLQLQNKTVEVTSYHAEPIQGTIDKRIKITEYKE